MGLIRRGHARTPGEARLVAVRYAITRVAF
jgi:hypothetical protein